VAFGFRSVTGLFGVLEGDQFRRQLAEIGSKSLPLVNCLRFALGDVFTLHTPVPVHLRRDILDSRFQARAFFLEIWPRSFGPLVAGRVGFRAGAVLSNMRATEQIDASIAFHRTLQFLVVPRIIACTRALPLLTLFLDFSGLLGGFLSEICIVRLSFHSTSLDPSLLLSVRTVYAPTLQDSQFLDSPLGRFPSFLGLYYNEVAQGVGRRSGQEAWWSLHC